MNVVIITARKGSETIKNKSLHQVAGKPLISYPIDAARNAKKIDRIYVDTDGEEIAEVGKKMGCSIIWRPAELRGPEVNHGEVIKHAVELVEELEDSLENVVLLLGNVVMIDGQLIDLSLTILEEHPEFDSVMSVWEAADDHPFRALEVEDGFLHPYGDPNRQVSTARQSYPIAYFYDQGVWTFRKHTVYERKGPNPWWWLGEKCYPIVRTWVTGRDIHTLFDVAIAEWYLENKDRLKDIM